MIEFINQYIGIIIGLLGIVIAILLWLLAKQRKRISVEIKSNNLIGNTGLDKIKVLYEDKLVENITVTKVILTNVGNASIKSDSIPPKNPIRLFIDKNYEILNIKVFASSSYDNGAEIDPNPHLENDNTVSYKLNFDYFDKKEGCVIQIAHTGPDDKCIHIKGKIIGGNNLAIINMERVKENTNHFIKIIEMATFVILLYLIISEPFSNKYKIISVVIGLLILKSLLVRRQSIKLPKSIKNVFNK